MGHGHVPTAGSHGRRALWQRRHQIRGSIPNGHHLHSHRAHRRARREDIRDALQRRHRGPRTLLRWNDAHRVERIRSSQQAPSRRNTWPRASDGERAASAGVCSASRGRPAADTRLRVQRHGKPTACLQSAARSTRCGTWPRDASMAEPAGALARLRADGRDAHSTGLATDVRALQARRGESNGRVLEGCGPSRARDKEHGVRRRDARSLGRTCQRASTAHGWRWPGRVEPATVQPLQ